METLLISLENLETAQRMMVVVITWKLLILPMEFWILDPHQVLHYLHGLMRMLPILMSVTSTNRIPEQAPDIDCVKVITRDRILYYSTLMTEQIPQFFPE